MIGDSSRVLRVFLPGNSKADEGQGGQDADAGGDDGGQRSQHREFLKASMIDSFWASLINHRKLTPSMGKMPNCLGLNEPAR
jgi:hypothetical protein